MGSGQDPYTKQAEKLLIIVLLAERSRREDLNVGILATRDMVPLSLIVATPLVRPGSRSDFGS